MESEMYRQAAILRLVCVAHLVGGAHLLSRRLQEPAIRRAELGLVLCDVSTRCSINRRARVAIQ